MPLLTLRTENSLRRAGHATIIGVDEVGRGCLAGPVVAAAAILPSIMPKDDARAIIRDSKTLSAKQRAEADAYLRRRAISFAIASASAAEVDNLNIHHASLLAMRRAIESLPIDDLTNSYLLVDGKFCVPNLIIPQKSVIHGDAKILSIAAASILAKVYRDNLLEQLSLEYPAYGFSSHKGYGTTAHFAAISTHGLTPHHRVTFCSS